MSRKPARRNLTGLKHQAVGIFPERWAGQQMGPTAVPWFSKGMSTPVEGTRPTVTTWQRSTGSWTVDALIGLWAFIYDSTDPDPRRDTGEWHRITDNTADTLTLATDVTSGLDRAEISMYNPISEEVAHGESSTGAYSGICFDGRYLWFAPRYANDILKLDSLTWDWEKIPHGQGNEAFEGCVFDGQCVWMVPRKANNWFKIDKDSNVITTWAHGLPDNSFSGAVFDGKYIWFSPRHVDLHRMDPATLEVQTYALTGSPASYKTVGANFDGKYVWIVPDGNTPYIYKINPVTDTIQTISKPNADYGYSNSIFDGTWLWLVPFLTADTPLTRINVTTNKMETIDLGETYSFHHHDGCFDGESLWLTPYNSPDFIKVNPYTGEYVKYPHGKGESAFAGCVFDGRSIWWAPYKCSTIVRQFPPRYGTGKPWDNSESTEIDITSGSNYVDMPRDSVLVNSSDVGSTVIFRLHKTDRPRRIVIINNSANSIDVSQANGTDSGPGNFVVPAGEGLVLYWHGSSSFPYFIGAELTKP